LFLQDLGANLGGLEFGDVFERQERVSDRIERFRKLGEDGAGEEIVVDFDAMQGTACADFPELVKLSLERAVIHQTCGDEFLPLENDRNSVRLLVFGFEIVELVGGGGDGCRVVVSTSFSFLGGRGREDSVEQLVCNVWGNRAQDKA